MTYRLPSLAYSYDALEPFIDRRTMEIHHAGHHAAYLTHLNAALDKHPELRPTPIEELLRHLESVPGDIRLSIRNNGGGHLNHSIFWQTIGPATGHDEPVGDFAGAIRASFGSFENFKNQFTKAAWLLFGSGWVWLVDRGDRLVVEATANQDSPFMVGRMPICGLDLWEHAYYLLYQNRRADYVQNWWHVVNWAAVERRYARELTSANSAA